MTLTPWWDDKTTDCPNQRGRGTCRFNKNELCLSMQASGECPAVIPPWGAWRSVAPEITEVATFAREWVSAGIDFDIWYGLALFELRGRNAPMADGLLHAVGWSP